MNDHIQAWHAEHAAVLATLAEIPRIGITTQAGQAKLRELEVSLKAHIKSENENLYPVLKKAAQNNPVLRQKMDLFARDMEEITVLALDFFDKFKKDPYAPSTPYSFALMTSLFKNRISSEESILIKEYEKLIC